MERLRGERERMCGGSSTASEDDLESIRNSKAIEKIIRIDEKRMSREVKMLLLGPGSSGKSTILKQMKVSRSYFSLLRLNWSEETEFC